MVTPSEARVSGIITFGEVIDKTLPSKVPARESVSPPFPIVPVIADPFCVRFIWAASASEASGRYRQFQTPAIFAMVLGVLALRWLVVDGRPPPSNSHRPTNPSRKIAATVTSPRIRTVRDEFVAAVAGT
jgi:hypothetical protein